MNQRPAFRFIAVLALICCTGLTARASSSPNLDAAINYLKAAKQAEGGTADPTSNTSSLSGTAPALTAAQVADVTTNLQQALKFLNRASNNKGGKRGEVIGLVNDAKDLIGTGDMDGANQKIDHAIAELWAAANHRGGW